MASEHLQARLAGLGAFPFHILFAVLYLPIHTGRRTEETVRGRSGLLQPVQRFDTAVLRLGFLRQYCYDQVVESIHGDTLARLDRGFRVSNYSRQRREGSTDASYHRQVCIRMFLSVSRQYRGTW